MRYVEMIREPKFHCKNCTERHYKCHCTCEIYAQDKLNHEIAKVTDRELQYGKGDASITLIDGIHKRQKALHLPYGNNPYRQR